MIKVLDLFSGTQSVKKGLNNLGVEYEYYGIDIYSPEDENVIIDLSQDNIIDLVVSKLPQGWKPNFIWASPVCSKFSTAVGAKNGTVYFEKTPNGLKPREDLEPLKNMQYKNYTLEKVQGDAILHLKLVDNMQKIIDYYDCDFVIENPRGSLIKRVLNPLYIMNKVDYCMYGFENKKPTTIYSNHVLELKTCVHKKHSVDMYTSIHKYSDRATVPPKLIADILKTFIKL